MSAAQAINDVLHSVALKQAGEEALSDVQAIFDAETVQHPVLAGLSPLEKLILGSIASRLQKLTDAQIAKESAPAAPAPAA